MYSNERVLKCVATARIRASLSTVRMKFHFIMVVVCWFSIEIHGMNRTQFLPHTHTLAHKCEIRNIKPQYVFIGRTLQQKRNNTYCLFDSFVFLVIYFFFFFCFFLFLFILFSNGMYNNDSLKIPSFSPSREWDGGNEEVRMMIVRILPRIKRKKYAVFSLIKIG